MPATAPMGIGPDVLRDPDRASRLEWFLGDGRGGYAASTALGLHTRREHSLLVVGDAGPAPLSLLGRVEEAVEADGTRVDLSTNAYPGAVHPRGFEQAVRFALDPLPTLTWAVAGGQLARTVGRLHGLPGVVIGYRFDGRGPIVLELRPLLAYREAHALQRENAEVHAATGRSASDVIVAPYPRCLSLHLRMAGATWSDEPLWYRRFEYARDREEGREHHEDLWSPGAYRVTLRRDGAVWFIAWAGPIPFAADGAALLAESRRRLRSLAEGVDGMAAPLRRAADAFVVVRDTRVTLRASFPALGESAAETAAAIPGVLVAAGRLDEARAALREVAASAAARAPGDGVDAPLWAAVAAERFRESTRDTRFLAGHLLDPLAVLVEEIRAGHDPHLFLRDDALLGVRGRPRLRAEAVDGDAPVEVQALWVNALLTLADVARESGRTTRAAEWTALAHRARDASMRGLWSEPLGYLGDAVRGAEPDWSLRPYQVLAIALPHSLLTRERAIRALQSIRRALCAPGGLREEPATAEEAPDGTMATPPAWTRPALAALYFEALIRVHGEEGKPDAWRFMGVLEAVLAGQSLGTLPALLRADPPFEPGGAVADAWTVGEVLRLAVRLGRRPAHRIAFRRV